ncbi:MAG: hypothetical protein JEZ12_24040 [Desulfobacterium sp.]|nr:hypothetical protein [Desulfobacterium sp.]
MIEIKSIQEGFRRCGMAHSETVTRYPGGTFTDEQLSELKAEPMLMVRDLPDEETISLPECVDEEDRQVFEGQTVKDLKASLDQLGMEYSKTAKKEELIDLIMLNTARGSEE